MSKKNMKEKFSDNVKSLLISIWEQEEILYDSSHADYFNGNKRLSALKRMCDKINENITEEDEESAILITVPDIRNQLKNLRTQWGNNESVLYPPTSTQHLYYCKHFSHLFSSTMISSTYFVFVFVFCGAYSY